MNENTVIHFGAFSGRKLKDIPDIYLIRLSKSATCPADLKAWIIANIKKSST